jgi:hypothetical protein
MERREQLEELHLALEGAVEQMTRAQRLASAVAPPEVLPADAAAARDLGPRLEALLPEIVAIRNAVREQLMRELARHGKPPKKLPVV